MYQIGEKYKSYALWDVEQSGKYDIFEVILHDGELAFFNHTDQKIYDLKFLGHKELVKVL